MGVPISKLITYAEDQLERLGQPRDATRALLRFDTESRVVSFVGYLDDNGDPHIIRARDPETN